MSKPAKAAKHKGARHVVAREWKVKISPAAEKEIKKLRSLGTQEVIDWLVDRIGETGNPRVHGNALKGAKLGALWKYRTGDFRIIAEIQDGACVVLVVRVANRKEAYR